MKKNKKDINCKLQFISFFKIKKMKKNKAVQIMAFLALFWIIIWVVGTGLAVIFSWNNEEKNVYQINNTWWISQEELEKLMPNTEIKLDSWSWEIK